MVFRKILLLVRSRHFTVPRMNASSASDSIAPLELRACALRWLSESDAAAKASSVKALADDWQCGDLTLDTGRVIAPYGPLPGRPERPCLVPPREVKHRSMRTVEGK